MPSNFERLNIERMGVERLVPASAPQPETFRFAANAPVRLDRHSGVFLVTKGYVDLFALVRQEGEAVGARRHVMRVEAGKGFAGFSGCDAVAVLAIGGLEAEVQHFPSLAALAQQRADAASLLEAWIAALAEIAFGAAPAWPEAILQPDLPTDCASGTNLRAGTGVLWAAPIAGSFAAVDAAGTVRAADPGLIPLAAGLGLRAETDGRCLARTTAALEGALVLPALERFHVLVTRALADQLRDFEAAAERRWTARQETNRTAVRRALTRLARIFEGPQQQRAEAVSYDPWHAAFAAATRAFRGDHDAPAQQDGAATANDETAVAMLARRAGFGLRHVLLRESWWRRENGPLIGQWAEDQRPVALLPDRHGRYRAVDDQDTRRVTGDTAAALSPHAITLSPPLPDDRANLAGMVALGFRQAGGDLTLILLMGLLGTLLGSAVPIATGFLFEWIVPRAEMGSLVAVIAGLGLAALGAAAFELVKSIALVRVESRLEATLQPAMMLRLLSLPVGFFREFGTGDLTDRVLAIQRIRRLLAGTTVATTLSSAFAVVSFVVILLYSPTLALIALVVGGLAALATLGLCYVEVRQDREAIRLGGREDGLIVQMIQGIAKLRIAAAEPRIFGLWAELFARRRAALLRGQRFANLRLTFYAFYPILASVVLYAAVAGSDSKTPGIAPGLSLGAFLAVSAAFGQLLAAVTAGGNALAGALTAVPLMERLRPFLTTKPEATSDKLDPGPLSDAIEMNHVTFRYDQDGPAVIDDLSFKFEPGKFTAIVGASGSGKSTLMRLLLGFETPESGDILYQGQPIAGLDVTALRRRIGVVLQNAKVMSGSIFENITAGLPYSLEDAWAAARMAGIAEDIEAMPMGMHSLLMEGMSTLSGGQAQRLMIARALIGRPQVLMFDEATSALDNVSQAVVTASLGRLHATRIVIAHRLTTIRDADKIFVMEKGRVVEAGGFDELLERDGAFAVLARRQLI